MGKHTMQTSKRYTVYSTKINNESMAQYSAELAWGFECVNSEDEI